MATRSFHRLLTAGASREMRERMEMEFLMLRDYDERDMELLRQKKQLQQKDEQLKETIHLLVLASVPASIIAERLGVTQEDVERMAAEG